MGFFKQATAATIAIAMVGSSALAAETIRPSDSLIAAPAANSIGALDLRLGTRISANPSQKNDLLGKPLFLVFLGAVAITIGTIIIVNNHHGNKRSPG